MYLTTHVAIGVVKLNSTQIREANQLMTFQRVTGEGRKGIADWSKTAQGREKYCKNVKGDRNRASWTNY